MSLRCLFSHSDWSPTSDGNLKDETLRVKVATLSKKYALQEPADDPGSEHVLKMKTQLPASSTPLSLPSKGLSSGPKSFFGASAASTGGFITGTGSADQTL